MGIFDFDDDIQKLLFDRDKMSDIIEAHTVEIQYEDGESPLELWKRNAEAAERSETVLNDQLEVAIKQSEDANRDAKFSKTTSIISIVIAASALLVAVVALILQFVALTP